MGYIGQTPSAVPLDGSDIADDIVDSQHYAAGSIDTAHIAANQIDQTLMKDAFVADFTEVVVTASDSILLGDATDGNTKRDTVQGILDLAGVSGLTNNSNTTWMTVSADEEITTPLQPSFQAYVGSTQSNKTGDGTAYTVTGAIWTEVKDTNADFTNGTFTAPVTGTYLFQAQVLFAGMGSGFTKQTIWVTTSNRPYRGWYEVDTINTSADQGRSFCCIADLDASDTAYITVQVSGGAKTVDITGTASAQTTNFSGFLLG